MDREKKAVPIPDRRIKERIVRSTPDYPLTPGLRVTRADAIGFIHRFDREEEIE
ncbi:hypothetical protein IC762_17630 [Bradyrhizobium genosp. L]|uniref:hypothetical protein n=1 Tax=Bradyrhizobium genosp. L TaxID=83637 RepID=UPI0018A26088|nr:hypothetical protein [Bradyrhizobium genosp. L]QPF81647.1 hypothetical protein IC762_17630 [Bradyrhizobium genosp. L]